MDLLQDFFGSIILEHLGAGFKWIIQFFITPFTQKKPKTFRMIINGSGKRDKLDNVYLGFSNILAGFFVIGIFILIILLLN